LLICIYFINIIKETIKRGIVFHELFSLVLV